MHLIVPTRVQIGTIRHIRIEYNYVDKSSEKSHSVWLEFLQIQSENDPDPKVDADFMSYVVIVSCLVVYQIECPESV